MCLSARLCERPRLNWALLAGAYQLPEGKRRERKGVIARSNSRGGSEQDRVTTAQAQQQSKSRAGLLQAGVVCVWEILITLFGPSLHFTLGLFSAAVLG
ncbi:hypothetical protein AOLI_G00302400 [Acnodon oligacanthus]